MQHHKQPSATKKQAVAAKPAAAPAVPQTQVAPKWKWAVLGFILLMVIGTGVWSTGIIQNAMAGPNIPLPRQFTEYTLGMSEDDLLKKHPEIKKAVRLFNNDPLFHIVTLTPKNGIDDASSLDLLFYKKQLYFVSTMWDGEKAKTVAVKDWAHQYRRWNSHGANSEPLGDQVLLKEWHFVDPQTEMTLRDLNYPEHIQRWQDIRDASNGEAQAAFAKYRLDAAG